MNKIDIQKLKEVASCFPTGVAVVSCKEKDENITGITINSYVSVSLSPPLILFSIQNESKFKSYCTIGQKLGFTILSEDQAEVSNHFAGFGENNFKAEFINCNDYSIVKGGSAWYKTEVYNTVLAGDHTLIICSIVDLGLNAGKQALLYYKGYKKLV